MSSQAVAGRFGVSSQWVRDRLRDDGVALRARGFARLDLDEGRLRVLYQEEGLAVEAIAARFERSPSTIHRLLRCYQIPLRPALPELSEGRLRELYVDEQLSVAEVARRCGVDPGTVARHLDACGIARDRYRRRPPWPDRAALEELYVEEGLTVAEVATRVSRSPQYISTQLDRYGIELRRPRPVVEQVPKQALVELYVEQRLTAAEVAAATGFSARAVLEALRYHGLGPRASGSAGRNVPVDPAAVIDLYDGANLSPTAIANRLRCPAARVRQVLVDAGIPRRRGHRETLPPVADREALNDLYVHQRLSHSDIAARYGVSTFRVKRRLQELRITRPPPARPPMAAPPTEELHELYVAQGLPFSEVGRRSDVQLSTLRDYIEGLGGHLEINAVFDDIVVPVALFLDRPDDSPSGSGSRVGHH